MEKDLQKPGRCFMLPIFATKISGQVRAAWQVAATMGG